MSHETLNSWPRKNGIPTSPITLIEESGLSNNKVAYCTEEDDHLPQHLSLPVSTFAFEDNNNVRSIARDWTSKITFLV